MTVHLHNYLAVITEGIADGAVFMHREMAALLASRAQVKWHDVTQGICCLDGVRTNDIVYTGIGPYAYLYHLWRERKGIDFRIIREVHTTLWSGYWAQEELCAKLTHAGDTVLFPSEFSRQLFRCYFPALGKCDCIVAYPIEHKVRAARRRASRNSRIRIGYLGALSTAKNFDQVLSIFIRCNRLCPGGVSLVVAGKPNREQWEQNRVREQLLADGAAAGQITLLGLIPKSQLPDFFSQIDVLLFPSTASRESLGRVMLEAIAHGVPVIAADFGPAVEILPSEYRIPTKPYWRRPLRMDRIEPLAQVDEAAAADRIFSPLQPIDAVRNEYVYRAEFFLEALLEGAPSSPTASYWDRAIVESVCVQQPASGRAADACCAESLFLRYFSGDRDSLLREMANGRNGSVSEQEQLAKIIRNPQKNIADYRSFPRLIDGLLLPPLEYFLMPTATNQKGEHGSPQG